MRNKGQESSKQQHLSTETGDKIRKRGKQRQHARERSKGEEQGRQKKNEKDPGKQQPLSHGQKSRKRGKQRQYARERGVRTTTEREIEREQQATALRLQGTEKRIKSESSTQGREDGSTTQG